MCHVVRRSEETDEDELQPKGLDFGLDGKYRPATDEKGPPGTLQIDRTLDRKIGAPAFRVFPLEVNKCCVQALRQALSFLAHPAAKTNLVAHLPIIFTCTSPVSKPPRQPWVQGLASAIYFLPGDF